MNFKKIAVPLSAFMVAVIFLTGISYSLQTIANERQRKEKRESMKLLFPGSEVFEQIAYEGKNTKIHAVFQSKKGYVIETIVSGYVDDICIWVGIDRSGYVTGVMIRDMNETWGLGRKAMTDFKFLTQFVGTKGEARIGQDIDALSGATVTSKAVARGVNLAAAYVTGADVSSGATQWED